MWQEGGWELELRQDAALDKIWEEDKGTDRDRDNTDNNTVICFYLLADAASLSKREVCGRFDKSKQNTVKWKYNTGFTDDGNEILNNFAVKFDNKQTTTSEADELMEKVKVKNRDSLSLHNMLFKKRN